MREASLEAKVECVQSTSLTESVTFAFIQLAEPGKQFAAEPVDIVLGIVPKIWR